MEKTKVVISGEEPIRMESGRYPCECCGRGVEENSMWCAGCERRESGEGRRGRVSRNEEKRMKQEV